MPSEWKPGDVFTIPINESQIGLGQIVDVLPSELYVVVYEEAWDADNLPPIETVKNRAPYWASLTLDAKLFHGHWKVIGNVTENLSGIVRPLTKVRISGKIYIQKYDLTVSRLATDEEAERLPNRKTVAPVRLEKSLQAHYNVIEGHPAYEELRYDRILTETKTFRG